MLNKGERILFIGLPCHVAGLRTYLSAKRIDEKSVFFVDLVCHGTSPTEYLVNHINHIEKKIKKKADIVCFRDPEFGTKTFTFTLKNNKKTIYKKLVHRDDAYQIGYHYGISYHDNCYNCSFASPYRQGDCTISDFSGLGKIKPCDFEKNNVSCLLINSEKGKSLISEIYNENRISLYNRPLEEALQFEKQLYQPTKIPKERSKFIEIYENTHDFDRSISKSARNIIWKNEIHFYFPIKKLINSIKSLVPKKIKNRIVRIIKHTK